jgi:hypothetical protein
MENNSNNKKEKKDINEFLYYSQYRKKLPLIYFFLTKEGIIWMFLMYIISHFVNFLFFLLILLGSFIYVIREFFHYSVIEKYELAFFKKIIEFLRL